MNGQQIEWAKLHNWYVFDENGIVYVESEIVDRDGNLEMEYTQFTDIKELAVWAGY